MDKSIMNVECVSFKDQAREHTTVFIDYPMKRHYKEACDQATFTTPSRLLPEINTNCNCKCDRNGNYSYNIKCWMRL